VGVEVITIISSTLGSGAVRGRLPGQGPRLTRLSGGLLTLGIALFAGLSATFIDLQPGQAQTAARAQTSAQAQALAQSRRVQEQAENDLVRQVRVVVNKSRTVRLDQPFEKAVVGAPDIVDALPMNNQTLYVQGKKAGTTNVSIFDNTGRLIEVLDIEVTPNVANLQDKIRTGAGSRNIVVSNSNDQIVLGGEAADAAAADRAVQIAKSLNPQGQVVNTMRIAPSASQQVMLKVQFLEAARSAGRELGITLSGASPPGSSRGFTTGTATTPTVTTAGGGVPVFGTAANMFGASTAPFGVVLANLVNRGTSVDMMVSALETQGLVRRLAEPTLIALSGDSASFLAGGEFPYAVAAPAGSPPTVDFKPFGVQLAFQPTVLANGVINLRLTPSVSEIDLTIAVNGTPGLSKREARTTVELRDGQSFAIAGLLQANNRRNVSQLPGIGSIPVLGALFRSAAFLQEETDLVVIVTPHLVAPATPDQRLASPLDQRLPSDDLDFFLLGQMEVRKRYTDYVNSGGSLTGPYGHMIRGE
jgi:pilus assembly protein CpaC